MSGGPWRTATVVLALAALALAGCGRGDDGADVNPEKGADEAQLNAALARELALVDLYTAAVPELGRSARLGRLLRAQSLEYTASISKAVRGLGGELDAEAEELDLARLRRPRDFLERAYALESEALAGAVEAAPRLNTSAPRTLFAGLAGGHAQHLVVLRERLGADGLAAIPEAFDVGQVPPPPPPRPVRDDARMQENANERRR